MTYYRYPDVFKNVTLVSSADWSTDPKKRWMALASKQPDHYWQAYPPTPVDEPQCFFQTLQTNMPHPGCILAGFDFPIGLPYNYALTAGITNYLGSLSQFGQDKWSQFYVPAENPSEISIYRPFYPMRPGGSRRNYIEIGLGLQFTQLFRLCEKSTDTRKSACPLFWTLGGQQVGKASINGWQSLITPALNDPELSLSIWPFSGPLNKLCQPGNIVVVEIYPAEFYHHLGLFPRNERKSKRKQIDRCSFADMLINWAEVLHLRLDDTLLTSIKDGFGNQQDSEDRFDALIGLYGMINIMERNQPTGEPFPAPVEKIEGWIFGLEQSKENLLFAENYT